MPQSVNGFNRQTLRCLQWHAAFFAIGGAGGGGVLAWINITYYPFNLCGVSVIFVLGYLLVLSQWVMAWYLYDAYYSFEHRQVAKFGRSLFGNTFLLALVCKSTLIGIIPWIWLDWLVWLVVWIIFVSWGLKFKHLLYRLQDE
jgi:hypothetical protein